MPLQGGRVFEGDFERAIKTERHALDAFVDGDPEPW